MNRFEEILFKYWGYKKFRPLQEDIIRSVVDDGKDTLGLLPTGGGKSIIFQVAALASDGLCLVVTPLIALMKDQVENLKRQKIKAAAIYSGMSRHQIDITLDNCIYGDYKFLYLSPERLQTEMFKKRLERMNINLIAIDEAHCISQWGYDFRPSYLQIAMLRDSLPDVPVLALTATATPKVVDDIQEKLKFKEKNVFRKSFERENLSYIVRETEDKLATLLKIAQTVKGSAVVYARIRKKTKEIAAFLQKNGISADFYHAGISPEEKDRKQKEWKEGKIRIIVSTNAFGMGIDKSDVRFVVHVDLPDSLEAYFQEAGRGGRDGKRALAVLLLHPADVPRLEKRIEQNFPPVDKIKQIYNALCNFFQLPIGSGKMQTFDFSISLFSTQFKYPINHVISAINILQLAGYLEFSEEGTATSFIKFAVNRDDLYKIQVKYASIDRFIKLILRIYTGVFTEYVAVDEEFLAKQGKSTRNTVYNNFKTLAKNRIIDYIPKRQMPYIQFTEERLPTESLYISNEIYIERKNKYKELIENVSYYANSKHKCRSRILMEYFGQKDAKDCGTCDVCRANKKSNKKLVFYEQKLKELAQKGIYEINYSDLEQYLGLNSEELRFFLVEFENLKLISLNEKGIKLKKQA